MDGSQWIPYHKAVAKLLGNDPLAALMLSYMISRHNLHDRAGELTADGFFYRTAEAITEDTSMAKAHREGAIKALKDHGLLEVSLRGVPATRHFRVCRNLKNQFDEIRQTRLSENDKLDCRKTTTRYNLELDTKNIEREIAQARKNALPFDVPDVDAPPVPPPPPADADPMPAKLAAREAIAAWLEKFPANREDWERRFGRQDWPALIATMVDNYSEATPHALRQDPTGVFRRHVGAWLEVRKNRRPTPAKKTAPAKGNPLTYDYTPPAGGNKSF